MSEAPDHKQPAFPIVITEDYIESWSGLSKREYFAAMALQGILSKTNDINSAEAAVWHADRLLYELQKLEPRKQKKENL